MEEYSLNCKDRATQVALSLILDSEDNQYESLYLRDSWIKFMDPEEEVYFDQIHFLLSWFNLCNPFWVYIGRSVLYDYLEPVCI